MYSTDCPCPAAGVWTVPKGDPPRLGDNTVPWFSAWTDVQGALHMSSRMESISPQWQRHADLLGHIWLYRHRNIEHWPTEYAQALRAVGVYVTATQPYSCGCRHANVGVRHYLVNSPHMDMAQHKTTYALLRELLPLHGCGPGSLQARLDKMTQRAFIAGASMQSSLDFAL